MKDKKEKRMEEKLFTARRERVPGMLSPNTLMGFMKGWKNPEGLDVVHGWHRMESRDLIHMSEETPLYIQEGTGD